jgi:hypothetical protein
MLANLASAILRSEGVNHWSLGSSGMLSWRCIADGSTGAGRFLIWHLLGDGRIAPEASSKTAHSKQSMQLGQRRHPHARHAHLHPGAHSRIQHPSRDYDDDARRRLTLDDVPRGTLLAPDQPDRAAVEGMPTIMDLDELPDMGRMTP